MKSDFVPGWPKVVFCLSLIRYASSLVVGVTSGLWICSPKTLLSWRRVFYKLCLCSGKLYSDSVALIMVLL